MRWSSDQVVYRASGLSRYFLSIVLVSGLYCGGVGGMRLHKGGDLQEGGASSMFFDKRHASHHVCQVDKVTACVCHGERAAANYPVK